MLPIGSLPLALLAVALLCGAALGQMPDTDPLYRLADGPAKMVNALWIEYPDELRFGNEHTKVVVAHVAGRGMAPCRARTHAMVAHVRFVEGK